MVKLLALLRSNPISSLRFLHSWFVQSVLILVKAFLLPGLPRYQSLRLQLHRAYWSASSYCFPELIHRLPVTGCPSSRALIVGEDFTGYIIPGTKELPIKSSLENGSGQKRRCVALFAHGGGYARGEARMYLNYMERWVKEAVEVGIDLMFLSVEYPLTDQAPQPAQQESFLNAYRYVLQSGVSPKNVIFMGDSAGGGLCVITSLATTRHNLPKPASLILVSPWVDMSLSSFRGGNALVETDYIVGANLTVPHFTAAWLNGERGDSPSVNPLFCASSEFRGLCPVLILAGGGEFAVQESKDLEVLLREAEVRHHLEIEWGQLHLYALGSKWVEPGVRRKTDRLILRWIGECLDEEQIGA